MPTACAASSGSMMSDFAILDGTVAPEVLDDALRIGRLLQELGVPHALIGGLAVGLSGFPRATKDVDYLVGPEAFSMTTPFLVYREELKDEVTMGKIDLLAVPEAYPFLAAQLRVSVSGRIPVIETEALPADSGRNASFSFVVASWSCGWS